MLNELCQQGIAFVQTVSRAVREDLETPVQYEVSFIRNQKGRIITDRRFNTASLMSIYLGKDAVAAKNMDWNPDVPNTLVMDLPGVCVLSFMRADQLLAHICKAEGECTTGSPMQHFTELDSRIWRTAGQQDDNTLSMMSDSEVCGKLQAAQGFALA